MDDTLFSLPFLGIWLLTLGGLFCINEFDKETNLLLPHIFLHRVFCVFSYHSNNAPGWIHSIGMNQGVELPPLIIVGFLIYPHSISYFSSLKILLVVAN